jgi:signal transduction histidine kinase
MTIHEPPSVLLVGSPVLMTGPFNAWLRAQFAEPLEIAATHAFPDALAYLRSHCADLAFVDETVAQNDLRAIGTASPATAVIGLLMRRDDSALLQMLRQGAHEVLCLLPSAGLDQIHVLQRALARVNGRTEMFNAAESHTSMIPPPQRLIHDLNNLLTSINGFADLLLAQLAPNSPARTGAEQIRLAGKRATTLLKSHSPTASSAPAHSAPTPPSVTVRAA